MEIKAKLVKPYTEIERENFIVEQNHNLGYEIIETKTALEALGKTAEELQEIKKENSGKAFLIFWKMVLTQRKCSKREVNQYHKMLLN